MNYLVTTSTDFNLEGYERVDKLSSVLVVDSNSVVIIHSFKEDDYDGSLIITDLYRKRGVFKLVYINQTPIESVRVLVESVNGLYEEDEYLLTDIDEINELVSVLEDNKLEIIESGITNIDSGFSVMTDFLTKFETGDSYLNDPLYLEVVNRAVNDIRKQVEIQEERTELMGKGVIETYYNTLEVINRLHQEAEEMKEKLTEIESSSKAFKLGRVESLSYYPPIIYAGNTPMVVFKEISACRYLTSFVLGYANHLQTVRSKRVRVIIVVGKQTLIKNKYKDMFELTMENYKTGKAIIETVAYTVTPIKALMLHMTKQSDELIIILDRTYEKDAIMKGKVNIFYGVSSLGEIQRENLDVSKCLMSMRGVDQALATIKHIQGYPDDVDSRLDNYERKFHNDFNKIDGILGMNAI